MVKYFCSYLLLLKLVDIIDFISALASAARLIIAGNFLERVLRLSKNIIINFERT